MADYDAKIRVSADTKQAESELSKLQKRISQLGDAAFKLDARNFQKSYGISVLLFKALDSEGH